jgi:hypothetical protein
MLTPEEKREILVHIRSLPSLWNVRDPEDLLEDRGCQITYSFVGHHEVIDVKERFDPDRKKRKELLKRYPFRSNTVEIKLAGTTSFDYNQKGKHKGFNVSAFIKQMGWKKEECVYVGDALFPGGNDDSIVGVIETKAVENPTGTFDYVQSVLGSDNV